MLGSRMHAGKMQRSCAAPILRKTCLRRQRCPAAANNGAVASSNGVSSSAVHPSKPSPAETARTIVDMVSEGTLSTLSSDGVPVGSPVSYTVDKTGATWVSLSTDSPEAKNLRANARCSLMVQPMQFPARAVAAVTLVGTIQPGQQQAGPGSAYRLEVDKALYYGGLDASAHMQEVSAADFQAAEPDLLRAAAPELVKHWNEDRAEDIYRIVSHQLKVPLTEMLYVELLWVDRLGMYVRTEVEGREPAVVRVSFYRPVLDERDARSVITMAAQIAWEAERPYNPSAIMSDLAANN